jgi:uncharacterized protein
MAPSFALATPPRREPRAAVLDTNVVLDWLAFADPVCSALASAIDASDLRWTATPDMRSELEHVLTREPFYSMLGDGSELLAAWDRWAKTVVPMPLVTSPALRCTDPDDQKFIDLALQLGPGTLLISRDRAVLRLARAAAARGIEIVSIADWALRQAAVSG